MKSPALFQKVSLLLILFITTAITELHSEVILQYFNTSWKEITAKMPELAEVGYDALWLPPPTKASGGLSVGYDCWDPFDLGSKNQRNSIRTRYGTEAELINLIKVAHRFGIRVYFDNIMNHRAFDIPGYNAYTPINIYPGMVPEDFHLRVTEEGFYRKWDNIANWNDTWQIQNRNFSDLIDIAQESPDNGNFGFKEGDHIPKIKIVRHPDNPEYYDFHPTLGRVGFNSTNITKQVIADNPDFYKEDVNAYLIRAVRWLVDRTKVDGLRLDAVKHVPAYFFGEQWAPDKDSSSAGYCGQAQLQFNITRGFSDWDNHRDTVFTTDTARHHGRDDLMMFGEHLGEPPAFSDYIAAGMRLVDSRLHGFLNGNLGQPWGTLDGLQYDGGNGFSSDTGVSYVKSHDDDYATRPELQFAYILLRRGLPNIYTDGNYQSETLGESGGAFPRHANTAFLGQWGDSRIPNLVYIHNQFAHGWQYPEWGDNNVCAFDRVDKTDNPAMSDADGAILSFMMNDNYAGGEYREIHTTFPVGAYLWQYADGGGHFYYTVPGDQKIKVIIPPGGYFAFSWRNPEESEVWSANSFGNHPVTIYENGKEAGWVSYERKDGPDGDPGFNPYAVPDSDTTDYKYTWFVPRVSSATNLDFVVRADGSAENILMKLDGGIDLNSQMGFSGYTNSSGVEVDSRDNPPALANDTYLGYEQMKFDMRIREKFAAKNITRNIIGSVGAESYEYTIGSPGFTNTTGNGANSDIDTAEWIYHDPAATTGFGYSQFWPAPENAADTNIYIWVKMGYQYDINKMYIYYTTDGVSWPEGSAGVGFGKTQVAELYWNTNVVESANTIEWWTGQIPPQPSGTTVRYKIGGFKLTAASVFPANADTVFWKKKMLTRFSITNFNAATINYHPHNDYEPSVTGLEEGFHVLRARAFLNRYGRAAVYNTFVQPFYYDTKPPAGKIFYPAENDNLGMNQYEVVVRTDTTVTKVWYHIADINPANDDAQTGRPNGNGTNAIGSNAWVEATQVTVNLNPTNTLQNEWRFNFNNIPTNSPATIYVKLAEISSATNPLLSDAEGRFTTLTRHITANGPDYSMFIAWPQNDGDTVSEGYVMKVWFSKALWGGTISEETARERFLITIDGNAQGRAGYILNWEGGNYGAYHELSYTLPDIYNSDPNYLHQITVTHTNAAGGGVTLTAHRKVRANPVDHGPYIDIVNPTEYNSDGKPSEIILPDVASPTPEDRQYTIKVATDLSVQNCWIEFTNSTGTVAAFSSTTNKLSGTVTVINGTNSLTGNEKQISGTVSATYSNITITGSNTLFDTELSPGDTIRIDTNMMVVSQILSSTSLQVNSVYPGSNISNTPAFIQPAFTSELHNGDSLLIDGYYTEVQNILSSSNVILATPWSGNSTNGTTAYRIEGNPQVDGDKQYWYFLWTNMTAGTFHFYAKGDTNGTPDSAEGSVLRNIKVILREQVEPDPNDLDDDDDGLFDANESTPTELPDTNPETWTSGDVHIWKIYGRTDPLLPDTDGDGLPDGLESGWRTADTNGTDITTDTNGDGYPNFIGDLDPPFFNTVPDNNGLPNYVFNDSRTKLIDGSMTDPQNPDSDYDGIPDGVEDANRNGWTDGDGKPLYTTTVNPWDDRPTEADWPDGKWKASWANYPGRETDPNKADTDEDGAADGYGEDINFNGFIDGDINSNRTWETNELWQETDPLNPDTDGDGLPDGWEKQYAFDPLNDGIIGHTNMGTGAILTTNDIEHGANGNPDGDTIVIGGVTNPYVNIMEYENGTNPRYFDTHEPPPEGNITIGRGPELGVINGITNYQEFTDWTRDDCLILDEYEGDGNNNQAGDVYKGWDGWDESRDITAFYVHDGGDVGNGGDGRFYFRLDFQDLKAHAEEGNLDIYVVIDTGNPDSGEMNLPDEVDTITFNRWEAVIAVYESGLGRVFIDTKRNPANNTTTRGQNLFDPQYGVIARDQSTPDGFINAYFNSDLDSVEFSISRQALRDAGWSGIGASNFNYQVFTTKDGTENDPRGPGDIAGRSDCRDAIVNDYIAEDYWQAQAGLESILKYWFSGTHKAGRAKAAIVTHENQAILPGSSIQKLINTDAGAGYYRLLEPHKLFKEPLNLHITPTLASTIEWAAVDPDAGKPWMDGPALNTEIRELIATNIVYMLGSTFADHMLPYFTKAFNRDNNQLAYNFLHEIYNFTTNANTVFWTPERLLDADTFDKVADMGYHNTIIDQDTHIYNWYGRQEALIDGGYMINKIKNINCFVINTIPTSYRFKNDDNGLAIALRSLFNRKARSSIQDQLVTIMYNWNEFGNKNDADAYDNIIRWIANHPWIKLVALENVAAGKVDISGDSTGDYWNTINRGDPTGKQAGNWLNHATQENYDNWYMGSANEESLYYKHFIVRPGVTVSNYYGMTYTDGIVKDAWDIVSSLADTGIGRLAREVLYASVLQTAFHNEDNNDLRRYSTGDYMYPATSSNSLADFAVIAQSQTRFVKVYSILNNWQTAASITNTIIMTTDADMDGENEYIIYNKYLFALFERIGGRIVGCWTRNNGTGYQLIGNQAGFAGSKTEEEGTSNVTTNNTGETIVDAYRTSALKDWWNGSRSYVNDIYTFTAVTNGWQITSSDSSISKTVTLAPESTKMEINYNTTGTLYIRNGLSPDLNSLLLHGQQYLSTLIITNGTATLVNNAYHNMASISIGFGDNGHNAHINLLARDEDTNKVDFTTVNMRNQAQTQQIELYGNNNFSFSIGLNIADSDWDGDNMPNDYEDLYDFLNPYDNSDGTNDYDNDYSDNADEYIAGTAPDNGNDVLAVNEFSKSTNGITIKFPVKAGRIYNIWYDNNSLLHPAWSNATPTPIRATVNGTNEWTDDGTTTAPHPLDVTNRFYKIKVNIQSTPFL